MKPLPTQKLEDETAMPLPVLPLNTDPSSFSNSNRKLAQCPIQRIYPWLLFASTAVAATFCLAYISKPVILPNPSPSAGMTMKDKPFPTGNVPGLNPSDTLLPDENILPGDTGSAQDTGPRPSLASDFEETNIRIQHVLDAESPTGDISRLTIDVPVLYRSRNLRWSQVEAERARVLLEKLTVHQEQVRALREQGTVLLDEWNSLMGSSIPGEALRADSPSLPANQKDRLTSTTPSPSDTVETIKLQKPENEK